jgi:hypothetical protein
MNDFNAESRTLDPRLQEIFEKEKDTLPRDKIKVIGQIFLYTVIVLLFKGGRNYSSIIGLESCGIGSYIVIFSHLVLSFLYSKSIAMKKYEEDS